MVISDRRHVQLKSEMPDAKCKCKFQVKSEVPDAKSKWKSVAVAAFFCNMEIDLPLLVLLFVPLRLLKLGETPRLHL